MVMNGTSQRLAACYGVMLIQVNALRELALGNTLAFSRMKISLTTYQFPKSATDSQKPSLSPQNFIRRKKQRETYKTPSPPPFNPFPIYIHLLTGYPRPIAASPSAYPGQPTRRGFQTV